MSPHTERATQTALPWGREQRALGKRKKPGTLFNLINWFLRRFGRCWAGWKVLAFYLKVSIPTVKRWFANHAAGWGLQHVQIGARRWEFVRSEVIRDSGQTDTAKEVNSAESEATKTQVLYPSQDYTDARKDATRTPTTTEQQGKPSTESVTNVPLIYPDNFRSFVGICVASGRGLSNPDIAAAFSTWQAKRIEELGLSEKVLNRYMAACRDASMPRYVPTPAMWLQMEGWTREELPRLLPPKGKVERALEGAREILKRRGLL